MKPRKVLVVDDSKLLHRMFELVLQPIPLVHAYDGRDALEQLRSCKDIDLVLLDLNMPNMNGLEVLAALKSDALTAHIPVVIVTTETTAEESERGLRAGAIAYVTKPFVHDELIGIIARLQVG